MKYFIYSYFAIKGKFLQILKGGNNYKYMVPKITP